MESQASSSLSGELLPGIADHVTLSHIVTKLPWTSFHVLSSVNRTWQRAIQSRKVYGERIGCSSIETLVVIKHLDGDPFSQPNQKLSLYSMTDKTYYELPPIPHLYGISRFSQLVSVHGKLYVWGGDFGYKCSICSGQWLSFGGECRCGGSRDIYVLDLAGQRPWRKCTSIQEPEREYEVSICCGFLGVDMQFIRGGSTDWFNSSWHICSFHPKDGWHVEGREWRVAQHSDPLNWASLVRPVVEVFTVQGSTYCLKSRGRSHHIYVYESNTELWTRKHTILYVDNALERVSVHSHCTIDLLFILPVNNELLALASCYRNTVKQGDFILQSRGFGTESQKIVWEKAPVWIRFDSNGSLAMCPIQL